MSATQQLYTTPRVQAVVFNKYLKKEADLLLRKNPLFAAMEAKKRISYGWSAKGPGLEFEWLVLYKGLKSQPYSDMAAIGASRTNPWIRAKLPWRGEVAKQSISLLEKKINGGGDTSIIRIQEKIAPLLTRAIVDKLAMDMFNNDGDGTGSNSDGAYNERIHGFKSFLECTGTTPAGGVCDTPNDRYAGISTVLGFKGGTWNAPSGSAWPDGTGSYEYSFWSPMRIDVENSKLSSQTVHTWATQWQDAMCVATTYLQSRFGLAWDVFVLSPSALRQAKQSVRDQANIFVRPGPQESLLVKLGWSPLSFEGVDIITDHNVMGSNTYGYGLIYDKLELRCLDKQLVEKSEDSTIITQADIIAVNFFGNLSVESPAFVCEFAGGIAEGS